jgi:hypothetical protein
MYSFAMGQLLMLRHWVQKAYPLTQCRLRKYEAGSEVVLRDGALRPRAGERGRVGSRALGIRALRRPIGTLLASRALEQLRENVACTGRRGLRSRDRALRDRAVS